jgi:hypothetical protein
MSHSDQPDGLLLRVDRLLRGGVTAERRPRIGEILIVLIIAGFWYGSVMGTYGGIGVAHWRQMIYSAIKVPLLLAATFWLSLPSFFVFNSLLGLRADFTRATAAISGAQAVLTIILAALAPLTAFFYVSGVGYEIAVLFNGLMFAAASSGAQLALRRSYRPLIAGNRRHRWTLRAWLAIYVFVGIQMGWTLRPFVGAPSEPTRFLRSEALTNAYVSVVHLVWDGIRQELHALRWRM